MSDDRLGRLASEAEDEVAKAHQDRAEFHGAFVAEIAVGKQAADERREINQRGEPAVKAVGRLVREEEVGDSFKSWSYVGGFLRSLGDFTPFR